MLHGLDGDFQSEGIGAGAAMAFEDFRHFADGSGEAREHVSNDADTDEGSNGQADFRRVDFGAESGDDARVFHLAHAFGNRRQSEADAASEFGKGEASVLLQLLQDMPASFV